MVRRIDKHLNKRRQVINLADVLKDIELMTQVKERLDLLKDLSKLLFNKAPEYKLEFVDATVWAGRARDNGLLEFNLNMLRENPETFIKDTVPHEYAHLVAGCRNHHNNIWRNVFVQFNGSGRRCHRYSVQSSVEQRQARKRK